MSVLKTKYAPAKLMEEYPKVQTPLQLPYSLSKRIKVFAITNDTTVRDVVVAAVHRFLVDHEKLDEAVSKTHQPPAPSIQKQEPPDDYDEEEDENFAFDA